jgi:hypothetical protein
MSGVQVGETHVQREAIAGARRASASAGERPRPPEWQVRELAVQMEQLAEMIEWDDYLADAVRTGHVPIHRAIMTRATSAAIENRSGIAHRFVIDVATPLVCVAYCGQHRQRELR